MNLRPHFKRKKFRTRSIFAVVVAAVLISVACDQLEKPKPKAFYAESEPPRAQEFRWSNGRMPESFDPLKAAAPPETDIVRAIFEGLTEIDPKTLEAVPGVAVKWKAGDDGREWTFELRKDAKWTNGDPVTAEDFVRSWKRAALAGKDAAHFAHIANIRGFADPSPRPGEHLSENLKKADEKTSAGQSDGSEVDRPKSAEAEAGKIARGRPARPEERESEKGFGVVAVEPHILKVLLKNPDAQFPRLVAHPVLRPVHEEDGKFDSGLDAKIITNGAFRVASVDNDGVTLERSDSYFGKGSVTLRKIKFVAAKDADTALQEYREGKVDAVTNSNFEPLALKLLTPYTDFQRTTHSALNFYEFNRDKAPFNDRRVREAMARAINRKRLADDLTEGAMEPAYGFLPFSDDKVPERITEDVGRARELMQRAGYSGGAGFPVVRLVINRNDLQQKVAREVAAMWKQNLGIETEIIVREYDEMEAVRQAGDYDLIRRGAVLPTSDETANMLAIFGGAPEEKTGAEKDGRSGKAESRPPLPRYPDPPPPLPNANAGLSEFDGLPPSVTDELKVEISGERKPILTEDAAIYEVPGIPLYFPTSYSLVKPYVKGFDINALDAPLLKLVRIDSSWKEKSSGE